MACPVLSSAPNCLVVSSRTSGAGSGPAGSEPPHATTADARTQERTSRVIRRDELLARMGPRWWDERPDGLSIQPLLNLDRRTHVTPAHTRPRRPMRTHRSWLRLA